MDSARLKKLQDYSVILTQQAESKEAAGNKNEAAKDYVKLVDVLLLLANDAKDHPSWQQLITRAESYQKKVRTMVDPGQAEGETQKTPSNVYQVKQPQQEQPTERIPENAPQEKPLSDSSTTGFNPFRKLIGRRSDAKTMIENNSPGAGTSGTTTVVSSWARDLESKQLPANTSQGSTPTQSAIQESNDDAVPRSAYSQVLEEKAALQKQIEFLRAREKEYLGAIEEKEKEFSQRLSQMVPRSEFEELKSKLANTVPRSQYDEALTISAIPKERYLEIQTQLSELQNKLQNSVSKVLMDDLAEYVSFLASTVSPTLIEDEENTEETSYGEN
jgi:hypothetical protein